VAHLVYKVRGEKGDAGQWAIAWTWLPYFISTNPDIIKFVWERMTEKFKGREVGNGLLEEMHTEVIQLILEKLPMVGLDQYLHAIGKVHPGEEANAS